MSESSTTEKVIGTGICLTAIVAGATKGFCDAQQIPLGPEYVDSLLLYGPTALGASVDAVGGGIKGPATMLNNLEKEYFPRRLSAGMKASAVATGVVVGGGAGAVKGGLFTGTLTAVGYGVGYAVGYITK